jgi:hypothetical protein
MPRNSGTRHKPKWQGKVEYKGRQKWVGTYDSLENYNRAKARCLNKLRDEVDQPCLSLPAPRFTPMAESQ